MQATSYLQRAPGGSTPEILKADDGAFYVTKLRQNAQHERVLVNEVIAHVVLDYLGLDVPPWRLVEVDQSLAYHICASRLRAPTVRALPCRPGLHFGSRYVGHPCKNTPLDYLAPSRLRRLSNPTLFTGVLAFDVWAHNADQQQVVFSRSEAQDGDAPDGYRAWMIDHGFILGAHHWCLDAEMMRGLYLGAEVYDGIVSLESFEPWLSGITGLPSSVLDQAYASIPSTWLDGQRDQLESVLDELYRRRQTPDLLRGVRDEFPTRFRSWRYEKQAPL